MGIEWKDDFALDGASVWKCLLKGGVKGIYASLVENSDKPKRVDKWNNELISEVDAKEVFDCISKSKHGSRVRLFQYKLLYRLFPTGQFLYFRKMVDSQRCSFCNHTNKKKFTHALGLT